MASSGDDEQVPALGAELMDRARVSTRRRLAEQAAELRWTPIVEQPEPLVKA
jgi:hypothetical protein